jgi:peroxiredoxin
MDYMELETRLNSAEEIGYPDIVLPDVNANKIRLSEVDSKVVMLFFWSSADASQKMFNLDFLKSVYEDYHKKGLEIYQVSLDVDKAAWARVVKEQKLPWINVCDSRGSASPYVLTYNIGSLPAVYVISDGELVDGEMSTEKSFRRRLEQLLK